jgi:hypothetical protein
VPERVAEEEAIKRTGEHVMFKLDEPLKICLLALASRHPDSLVEINKDLLDRSDLWEGLYSQELGA